MRKKRDYNHIGTGLLKYPCIKLSNKKALQDIHAKYIEDSCDLFFS